MNIKEMLSNAEKIQQALTFCHNYRGDHKEVKEWCAELEKEVLLGMARGITGNASFYDTNNNGGNDNRRNSFRASKI